MKFAIHYRAMGRTSTSMPATQAETRVSRDGANADGDRSELHRADRTTPFAGLIGGVGCRASTIDDRGMGTLGTSPGRRIEDPTSAGIDRGHASDASTAPFPVAPSTRVDARRGAKWRAVCHSLIAALGFAANGVVAAPPDASLWTDAGRQRVIAQIDGVGRRGFLYEVSRPSGASGGPAARLFLYGTIHLGRVGSEPFNPPLVKALRGSRRLVLEADPSDSTAAQALAMALGRYPDGDGLERHVSPELWLRIRTFGARLGIAPERVDRFRPWLLANMVALTELSGAGLDPMLGSELYLSGFARRVGMPIVEVEGLETQLRFLAALPEPVQTAQLDEALTDADRADVRAEGQALFSLWLRGDRLAGDALVAQMHRDAEGRIFERYFVDTLIDARNRTMADKAEACLDEPGDTVFAVGSLHLFGEAGLLRELERRGYRVTDVQQPASPG